MAEELCGGLQVHGHISDGDRELHLFTGATISAPDQGMQDQRIMHQRLCAVSFLITSSVLKLNQDPALNKVLYSAFKKYQGLSHLFKGGACSSREGR